MEVIREFKKASVLGDFRDKIPNWPYKDTNPHKVVPIESAVAFVTKIQQFQAKSGSRKMINDNGQNPKAYSNLSKNHIFTHVSPKSNNPDIQVVSIDRSHEA